MQYGRGIMTGHSTGKIALLPWRGGQSQEHELAEGGSRVVDMGCIGVLRPLAMGAGCDRGHRHDAAGRLSVQGLVTRSNR